MTEPGRLSPPYGRCPERQTWSAPVLRNIVKSGLDRQEMAAFTDRPSHRGLVRNRGSGATAPFAILWPSEREWPTVAVGQK
jgi:hypothetical protein